MIISPYRTQFTKEHQEGKRDPQRNMTNRKSKRYGSSKPKNTETEAETSDESPIS
jgi:hypothetical protein